MIVNQLKTNIMIYGNVNPDQLEFRFINHANIYMVNYVTDKSTKATFKCIKM